jgi:hypothetical protein
MRRLFDVQSRFPGWQATVEYDRVCMTERAEHEESSRRGEYTVGFIPGAEFKRRCDTRESGITGLRRKSLISRTVLGSNEICQSRVKTERTLRI